jgi:hypothetical protein
MQTPAVAPLTAFSPKYAFIASPANGREGRTPALLWAASVGQQSRQNRTSALLPPAALDTKAPLTSGRQARPSKRFNCNHYS